MLSIRGSGKAIPVVSGGGGWRSIGDKGQSGDGKFEGGGGSFEGFDHSDPEGVQLCLVEVLRPF